MKKYRQGKVENKILGASSEVETPLPIPNRAVKHFSADGTSMRESRPVPRILVFTNANFPFRRDFFVGKFEKACPVRKITKKFLYK